MLPYLLHPRHYGSRTTVCGTLSPTPDNRRSRVTPLTKGAEGGGPLPVSIHLQSCFQGEEGAHPPFVLLKPGKPQTRNKITVFKRGRPPPKLTPPSPLLNTPSLAPCPLLRQGDEDLLILPASRPPVHCPRPSSTACPLTPFYLVMEAMSSKRHLARPWTRPSSGRGTAWPWWIGAWSSPFLDYHT